MTANWHSLRGTLEAVGLHAGTFWRWLTEPDETVQKPEHRRRARLLAGMLVIIILVGIWIFFDTLASELAVSDLATVFRENVVFSVTPIALVICGVAYGLSRSKHYAWGALILIVNIYIADFVVVAGMNTPIGVVGILGYFDSLHSPGKFVSSLVGYDDPVCCLFDWYTDAAGVFCALRCRLS
jgi:hypothetical protein